MLWAALGRTEHILEISVYCSFLYWREANFDKTWFLSFKFPFSVPKEGQRHWAPSGSVGFSWNKHKGQALPSELLHDKESVRQRQGLLVGVYWPTQPASPGGFIFAPFLSEVQAPGWHSPGCLGWWDGGPEMCKQDVFAAPTSSQQPGHHIPELLLVSSWGLTGMLTFTARA